MAFAFALLCVVAVSRRMRLGWSRFVMLHMRLRCPHFRTRLRLRLRLWRMHFDCVRLGQGRAHFDRTGLWHRARRFNARFGLTGHLHFGARLHWRRIVRTFLLRRRRRSPLVMRDTRLAFRLRRTRRHAGRSLRRGVHGLCWCVRRCRVLFTAAFLHRHGAGLRPGPGGGRGHRRPRRNGRRWCVVGLGIAWGCRIVRTAWAAGFVART
nr:hypothetical protein RSP597_00440 [Ralstonia solanacearum]